MLFRSFVSSAGRAEDQWLVVPSSISSSSGWSCRRCQAGRAVVVLCLGLINHTDILRKLGYDSPNWPWPGWSPWSMAQPYSVVFSSVT